jgi:prepilin peptidase CpaA
MHPDLPSLWTTLWFLPFVTGIGLWVAWSDLKFMTIPNAAVLSLLAVWAVIGPIAVPVNIYLAGWGAGLAMLILGFLLSTAGQIGAGDAKFAAAMAPFFAGADLRFVFLLAATCILAGFVTHRALRGLPSLRRATPDWASWTDRNFPMGFSLAGILWLFFLCALVLNLIPPPA